MEQILNTDESLNEKCEKIEILMLNLFELMENSNERVETYCEFLRNEVDICTESQMMLLQNYREQMFDDINSYHDKCIQYKKQDQINEIKDSIKRMQSDLTLIKSKIYTNTIDVIKLKAELSAIEEMLREKKQILNDLIFCEKKLVFLDSELELKQTHIGQLGYENNIPERFQLKSIEKLKPIKVRYLKQDSANKTIHKVCACEIFEYLIGLAYTSATKTLFGIYSFKLTILLFNANGACLKETTSECDNINILCMTSTLNRIVIASEILNKPAKLQAYDENLNLKAQVNIDYCINSIHSQNTRIYLFTTKQLYLHIFNESLQEILTFGQSVNPNTAFYLKLDSRISFIENYFLTYDKQCLRINKNGYALRTIEFNKKFDYFQALSVLKYLFVDFNERHFLIYDFNGICSEKCFLKHASHISSVFVTKKNNLVIVDSYQNTLYIY